MKKEVQALVENLLASPHHQEEVPSIQSFADQYGEDKIVQFIYNRHCSRFRPADTDLSSALDIASSYRVDEDTILQDLITVEGYGDLDQYFRP